MKSQQTAFAVDSAQGFMVILSIQFFYQYLESVAFKQTLLLAAMQTVRLGKVLYSN